MNQKKKYLKLVLITILVLWISIIGYWIGPSNIVEIIGENNAYLFIGLFAFYGGISTLTSVSFHAANITLALWWLDPLIITLVTGPWMLVGNCLFYYFWNSIESVLSGRIKGKIQTFTQFLFRPKIYKRSPFFVFLYVSVSWLPPDLLIFSLALAKYPLKKMLLPLFLGEMLFVFLVTSIAKSWILF
jgi:hypothetical protein